MQYSTLCGFFFCFVLFCFVFVFCFFVLFFIFDCLEHKHVKYMQLTHDKRV